MSTWLLPCNPQYYNIDGVYKNLKTVDWKQSLVKVEVGDEAYIYVSNPVGAIVYKCVVLEINKPEATIDDSQFHINSEAYGDYGRYMELKFVGEYHLPELSYSELKKNGLKGRVQRQISMNEGLEKYVNSIIAQ
jgi:5-methylcytosine-specific restriction protein A